MRIQDAQLKRFILDSGLVTQKDLDSAEKTAADQKLSLGTALVNQGSITEDDVRRVESYVLGVPFIALSRSSP
jgi:hypothetical protein